MARQKGVVKLHGTIDDLTFLRTRDGFLAKMKTSLTAARLATDPAFVRTRENGSEFARAGKAGKLLRSAFRLQMLNAHDRSATSRLTEQMVRVVKTDAINARGERNVEDGEKSLLRGFEFNNAAQLETSLYVQFTSAINRATGEASVDIPSFIPMTELVAPLGSTHFRIVAAAAAIDFVNSVYERKSASSGMLPIDKDPTAALNLACALAPDSPNTIFLVLGIEYFQMVNSTPCPLKSGVFNALTIIGVDQPA